jgi:hypothetical protein
MTSQVNAAHPIRVMGSTHRKLVAKGVVVDLDHIRGFGHGARAGPVCPPTKTYIARRAGRPTHRGQYRSRPGRVFPWLVLRGVAGVPRTLRSRSEAPVDPGRAPRAKRANGRRSALATGQVAAPIAGARSPWTTKGSTGPADSRLAEACRQAGTCVPMFRPPATGLREESGRAGTVAAIGVIQQPAVPIRVAAVTRQRSSDLTIASAAPSVFGPRLHWRRLARWPSPAGAVLCPSNSIARSRAAGTSATATLSGRITLSESRGALPVHGRARRPRSIRTHDEEGNR